MHQWIEHLAARIARKYTKTPLGHAARLDGLDLVDAKEFCKQLQNRLDDHWDIMIVTNQPETDHEVELDVAIERRNDKSKCRFFIIPANLVAESAASLADTEVHHVTEHLRPISRMLLRKLPNGLHDFAKEAMKRKPPSACVDFLCVVLDSPTLEDCGKNLWKLGLVADLKPTIEKLTKNKKCMAQLTDPRRIGKSVNDRVQDLGLIDTDLRVRLTGLLRETGIMNTEEWLRRIAEEPGLKLTFDQWDLSGSDDIDLRAIEVHSFVDSKKHRAYAWSGLILKEGTLQTKDPDKKVTVHWSTEPKSPTGTPLYEIILETSEPQPVELLSDTKNHKDNKFQSWSFSPSDIEGIEEGSLRVRFVVRSFLEKQQEWIISESDEFLLTEEQVDIPSPTAFPPTRSIPDFVLERAKTTKKMPEVSRCEITKGSGVKVELDERQRKRIVLSPVLERAERDILATIDVPRSLSLEVSPEIQWSPEDIKVDSVHDHLEALTTTEWWKTRKRLFAALGTGQGDGGLVEASELANHSQDIRTYCRGYIKILDKILDKVEEEGKSALEILADLVQIDSIRLLKKNGTQREEVSSVVGLLVSPLHPMRLLWHLAHETLIREWIKHATDRSMKAILPTPEIAAQLDGGNCPGFLAAVKTLFYYVDSPLFHWPLFINAEESEPHTITALVRWGLGLRSLDTLTVSQEMAANTLTDRLQTYVELHPYIRTLKINAVNVGDGQLLLKTLSAIESQDQRDQEEGEAEQVDIPSRAYEVRLYGPKPVHLIGAFLDECAEQRRRGHGIPQKLDRLFRPGSSFLSPRLFWAKRELKHMEEKSDSLTDEAHLAFVTEYFHLEPALVYEDIEDAESTVSTYGLQTDLTSQFYDDEKKFSWVRTIRIPQSIQFDSTIFDRRFANELLRLHRSILKAAVELQGGNDEQWPATRVPISPKQFNLFAHMHERSDWVLTLDRNLGIDLFDSPSAEVPELQENARRYLIDYSPEPLGSAGLQLMISTSWVEEVSELLRETLREMFISPTDLACDEVLRLLKSISGKLVMRVARYPEVTKEAVSLAVVREILRGGGRLDGKFLVPVDEHIQLFVPYRGKETNGEARRPDLLLVCPRLDKKATLQINIIEVKYRRHRHMATDRSLWSDMLEATRAGEAALTQTYFPSDDKKHLDLPLRRRQLKMLFAFYIRRAVRHGLLDSETGDKYLNWLNKLDRQELALEVNHQGFVYSPEFQFETEDYKHEEMTVTLIGREALPRYTSLTPSELPSIHPVKSQEEESVTPIGPEPALEPISEPAEELISPVSTDISEERREEVAEAIDLQEAADHSPTPLEGILLGHETKREKPIYFRPSLKGNPHGLIVGIPGMGKTTALLNVSGELGQGGVHPFIIDFHGDIAREVQSNASGSQYAILDAAQGLTFNPLEVDPKRREHERGWVEHYFEIAEILSNIYPSFGELQVGTIRDSLRECYEATGFQSSPHEAPAPPFVEFWNNLLEKAEKSPAVRKITTRLEAIFHLQLFREDREEEFFVDELLSQTTVLDLHRLGLEENQRVAASFFLQRLYRNMFSREEVERLSNAVIFDEAHRVAKLKLIPKMMQECRKYGILFILSSQRVEDFDRGVLDSAGNHLYLRVNHPDARKLADYLAAGKKKAEFTEKLQNLPKFHALFRSEDYKPFVQVRLRKQ
jgi:DNA helicase HerA-like ATPase